MSGTDDRFPPWPVGSPAGFAKPRLFTPGPTLALPEARRAALAAEWHHRTPSFEAAFAEARRRLGSLMGLEGPVYLLSASGTGAMEAAVVNTVAPGEEAVTISAGKFGERWGELLTAFGAVPHVIDVPWGSSAGPEDVRAALRAHPGARAVFVQASETSTGASHDLPALGSAVREADGALLVADVISWMGAAPLHADAWGVDVVVGASQKALMTGPGLSWVGLGRRASERLETSPGAPRYYLDLRKQARQEEGRSAFTPAVDLVIALLTALRFVQEEVGADRFAANASRQAAAFRGALPEMGLEMFPSRPSPSLSAVRVPGGLDGKALLAHLDQTWGIKAAGGQGSLSGRILRFAHMGYYDLLDTIGCVAALERTLQEAGHPVSLGAGPAAAQEAAHAFDEAYHGG